MTSRNRDIAKSIGQAVANDVLDPSGTLGETSITSLNDVNLTVNPETLEIQVVSAGPGQNMDWLWTWTRSALPYARVPITNSVQNIVPLYKEGTYTINNYSGYDSDAFATGGDSNDQTHKLYLKWIDGAGTDNLVPWVTYTAPTDNISTINGGASTTVQRLLVDVPDSDTLSIPTADSGLTAPTVSYSIEDSGGKYKFSGSATGGNPNIGPIYKGGTYNFNVNATGHPFYITTDNGANYASGQYVSEYTTGVTNSRTQSGTLTLVVDSSAPSTLYYQCGNHAGMRGVITVKDLAVETDNNNRPVLYLQHTQEGMKNGAEIRPVPNLTDQMCIVFDVDAGQFVPQDLATYVERTPSFKNKIQEVAGTATLVAADGTPVVASVEVIDDASYLSLSGNSIGDLVYATDTETIYVWDGDEWQQNTAGVDSAATTGLIDSDYIQARQASASVDYTVALRQDGTLETHTGTARWYAPTNINISNITARLSTAATGSSVNIRTNKSGSSANTLSISAGSTSASANTNISMAATDYLTLDVTQIGSSTAGEDLYVQYTYTKT